MSLFSNFKDPLYWSGLPFAIVFGVGGLNHFADPEGYIGLMKGMPFPELHPAAVSVSGVIETLCGWGSLIEPSSQVVNWTLATLAAVSPVHYYMYIHDTPAFGNKMSEKDHLVRASIQLVFFAWLSFLRKAYLKREADDSKSSEKKD